MLQLNNKQTSLYMKTHISLQHLSSSLRLASLRFYDFLLLPVNCKKFHVKLNTALDQLHAYEVKESKSEFFKSIKFLAHEAGRSPRRSE